MIGQFPPPWMNSRRTMVVAKWDRQIQDRMIQNSPSIPWVWDIKTLDWQGSSSTLPGRASWPVGADHTIQYYMPMRNVLWSTSTKQGKVVPWGRGESRVSVVRSSWSASVPPPTHIFTLSPTHSLSSSPIVFCLFAVFTVLTTSARQNNSSSLSTSRYDSLLINSFTCIHSLISLDTSRVLGTPSTLSSTTLENTFDSVYNYSAIFWPLHIATMFSFMASFSSLAIFALISHAAAQTWTYCNPM